MSRRMSVIERVGGRVGVNFMGVGGDGEGGLSCCGGGTV